MKSFCIGAFLLLGCAGALNAQTSATRVVDESAPVDFASTSAAQAALLEYANPALVGSFSNSSAARRIHASSETFGTLGAPALGPLLLTSRDDSSVAIPAEPAPAPPVLFGDRDDYRWQVGLGFTWERFRSSVYNASAVGLNTSVSYFTNDWFAIDGSVSSVFAPPVQLNEHVKLVNYGVGPKIAWRQRRWEPFLHVLVGGTHALPQTALGGKTGLMLSPGGGADYRWLPRLSLRVQGDYVRTSLWGQTQNNFQLTGGVVFHF